MVTKAQLETELEKLRTRNAQLAAKAENTPANDKDSDASTPNKTAEEIKALLSEHGIDLTKAEEVGEKVVAEFGRLQKSYPITTLIAAFALGYLVGRTQK